MMLFIPSEKKFLGHNVILHKSLLYNFKNVQCSICSLPKCIKSIKTLSR